jgi:hypothetical protein
MPGLTPPRLVDPQSAPTHARGRWFAAVLIGVWPIALAAAALAVALGLPAKLSFGSALAGALAIDFITIVLTFAVDDGDVQHLAE